MQRRGKSDLLISNGNSYVKTLAVLWPIQINRVVSLPFILDLYQCHVSHHIMHLQAQPRGPRLNRNAELSSYTFKTDLKQILFREKKIKLKKKSATTKQTKTGN